MKYVVILLVVVFAAAALAWPHVNEVATGRSPEYPDLRSREYGANPDQIAQAVKKAIAGLPGWALVGSGAGPGGTEVRAVHTTLFGIQEDVTVLVRGPRGKSSVSVRSHSQVGPWDFGQNARNVRAFLGALDHEVP